MKRSPWSDYLLAGSLLGCAAAANAVTRPAVIELFTSEGCSSCPPAEAYIGELVKRRDVLALTFHVDYWDELGWKDRFGLPEAVQRQRAYARSLRLSTVYTPQVVIDGQADFVGSDRSNIGDALRAARSGVAVALSVHDGEILIDLDAAPRVTSSEILLVAYQRTAVSPIGRGENAGRTITEHNIVRAFRSLGRWDGQKQQFRSTVESLPRDATDVAVLVQPPGQAPIIGAAALALR
jgi:hypothetical protein